MHIVCLSEVLIAEAERCQRPVSNVRQEDLHHDVGSRMTGDVDSNHRTQTQAWPCWYTWPLLSRIAFTLANLTTSNDANRCVCVRV